MTLAFLATLCICHVYDFKLATCRSLIRLANQKMFFPWLTRMLNHLNASALCQEFATKMTAGVGLWLVVMGGRTADIGWFRTKTDTFLNDVFVLDR